MIRACLSLALVSVALPALAQTSSASAPADPPKKIRNVMLTPGERCPAPSSPDEVVVCGNLEERYRIPRELRNEAPIAPENQSWASKQDRMDEVGRAAGGVPNSCSPVGTAGQSGCNAIMLDRARADQRDGNTTPPRR